MARRTKGEGSVYMRKDGRAAASAIYEGKRITKYGKTKTEARQKLDAYLADLKAGKIVIGPKQTVAEYLTHWLEDSRRLKIELGTLENYRCTIRVHLLPAFGHLQLNHLAKEHVQAFCAEKLDAGYAPSTIRFMHTLLSTALRDAVVDGVLARNVCDFVTIPKQKKHKRIILNVEQCKQLLSIARGRRLWLLILMAITTGARVGELCALRWSDIDIERRRIHFHRSVRAISGKGMIEKEPKTESGYRQVVLAQVVAAALPEQQSCIDNLRRRAGEAWKDFDLVFPNRRGGYLRECCIIKSFRAILQEAGLPVQMRFHDLRHSAATLLFAAGVNPKVVQELLGHSSANITLNLYGGVTPDMQEETGRVMDQLFSE